MDGDAEQRLDGNAAAGLLREVFAADLTTATVAVEGCGRNRVLAALMLCGGAFGAVLRCLYADLAMLRLIRRQRAPGWTCVTPLRSGSSVPADCREAGEHDMRACSSAIRMHAIVSRP
jgi:hypothetical protein